MLVMCVFARVMLPPAQGLSPLPPPPPIKSTRGHKQEHWSYHLQQEQEKFIGRFVLFLCPSVNYDFPKHPKQILNISVQINYLATQLHHSRFLSRVL